MKVRNKDWVDAPFEWAGIWWDFKKKKWVSFLSKGMKYKARKIKK